jgi:hypothetical protein
MGKKDRYIDSWKTTYIKNCKEKSIHRLLEKSILGKTTKKSRYRYRQLENNIYWKNGKEKSIYRLLENNYTEKGQKVDISNWFDKTECNLPQDERKWLCLFFYILPLQAEMSPGGDLWTHFRSSVA